MSGVGVAAAMTVVDKMGTEPPPALDQEPSRIGASQTHTAVVLCMFPVEGSAYVRGE